MYVVTQYTIKRSYVHTTERQRIEVSVTRWNMKILNVKFNMTLIIIENVTRDTFLVLKTVWQIVSTAAACFQLCKNTKVYLIRPGAGFRIQRPHRKIMKQYAQGAKKNNNKKTPKMNNSCRWPKCSVSYSVYVLSWKPGFTAACILIMRITLPSPGNLSSIHFHFYWWLIYLERSG